MVSVHDITNKILSRDSNYIVDVVMCQSLVMRDVISQPQFYRDLTRKTAFFEGWPRFKFNNLGLALGKNLKCYISVAKGVKLKVRIF